MGKLFMLQLYLILRTKSAIQLSHYVAVNIRPEREILFPCLASLEMQLRMNAVAKAVSSARHQEK